MGRGCLLLTHNQFLGSCPASRAPAVVKMKQLLPEVTDRRCGHHKYKLCSGPQTATKEGFLEQKLPDQPPGSHPPPPPSHLPQEGLARQDGKAGPFPKKGTSSQWGGDGHPPCIECGPQKSPCLEWKFYRWL